jgi:phage tail sheath gpL-like
MGIDASARARAVGIDTQFKDFRSGSVLFLEQRIAVFAQGSSAETYDTTKWQATSASAGGSRFGFGSPIHKILEQLLPVNGDGVGTIPVTVYPLEDGYEAVTASGTITPAGAQTEAAEYRVRVSGVLSAPFVIDPDADSVATICDQIVAAINAIPGMPVIATDNTTNVGIAAKWAGPTGNDLVVEIIGDVTLGVTFTIVQPTGGLVNPDITAALAQMGDIWETMVLNALNIADTAILDEYQEFGEGRWGALVHKPLVVFTGNTEAVVGTATAGTAARTDDRINCQLVAPGSPNLPFVVAARELARIAKLANDNPPHDYGSQRATGLIPGTDGEQWNYTARDQAVKAGSSTVKIKEGVVTLQDVVTMYAPEGEEPPGYSHVVDIVKLQNIHHNLALIFDTAEWDGAPLVPDDQTVTNPSAKKPSMAKAEMAALADDLAAAAIISDPAATKAMLTAVIDSQNPKRMNLRMPVKLSGNSNIIDAIVEFGFHFQPAA